jgi:hypothetical protein
MSPSGSSKVSPHRKVSNFCWLSSMNTSGLLCNSTKYCQLCWQVAAFECGKCKRPLCIAHVKIDEYCCEAARGDELLRYRIWFRCKEHRPTRSWFGGVKGENHENLPADHSQSHSYEG